MYDNLKNLGISNPEKIESYSLRQEVGNDILKIYFHKGKGTFLAKSVKLKFPRQRKAVNTEYGSPNFTEVYEISPNLQKVIDELDKICEKEQEEIDLKSKILSDLKHLERVVSNKISEIEADLEKLTKDQQR